MGSEVRLDPDDEGRLVGDTLWAARLDGDRLAGLAWEWVLVRPGVPAIRDVNGLVSNLLLLSQDGTLLTELQALVGLNVMVHRCRWQATLRKVVRETQVSRVAPRTRRTVSAVASG
jgi:hypothetical protein